AASLGSGVTIKLADFPALATPGTVVDVGHVRAVVRTGDTTFLGLSRVCTHEGCEANVEQNQIRCPCHHSVFSATAHVIRGPDTGATIGPLNTVPVVYDAVAGTLTIS